MAQLNNANIDGSLDVTSFIAQNGELIDNKYGHHLTYEWRETASNSQVFQYYICLTNINGAIISRTALTGLTRTKAQLDSSNTPYIRA